MAKKPNKKPVQPAQPITPAPASKPVPQNATPREKAAMPNVSAPASALSVRTLCIALGVISFILYANTLLNGFVMDDVMVLKENNMVMQGFKGIPELLSTPHMRGYLIIPNDLYRPLSLVMFAAEYQLFGLSPSVHHFFNVLTFAGCVIMLFLFLDKFFGGKKTAIAFVAALLFAVHPIHTEVVANIKSRDELMCFFFGLWSLNLFMNYMKSGKMMQLIAGVFVLFLSYISKETVIAFLAIIPLLFFFYNNEDKKRAVFITGGAVVATVVFLIIRSSVLSAYNANQPAAGVEFIDNALSGAPNFASKVATEIVVLGRYLWLMIIPYPLLCTYSYNAIPFADFASISMWLSLAAYVAMIYFAVTRFLKNRKDPWAFGIIFYLATLFLFSNLPFLMGAELAERFAFFASAGFCLVAALAVEQWIIKAQAIDVNVLKSTKVLAVLVPVCLIFSVMTFARNADWKDNYTLYKADVQKSPNDCRLYHNLASAAAEDVYPDVKDSLKRKEMDKECIGYLRKALEIFPEYADAHVEMGRIFDRDHMPDSAIVHDTKALQLNPTNATANNNLGSMYLNTGHFAEAALLFRKSLELNPNLRFPFLNLARAYLQMKKFDSAIMFYRTLYRFDARSTDATLGIGIVYFQAQRYDSAVAYFKQVLEITPDEPNAITYMGASLLNNKKYAEAITIFKKSLTINPNDMNAYSNMGRAYYFSQQYDAAIEAFNKEISIDPKNGPRDLPYIALSYQKLGKMDLALKYEALAKQVYSNFKLD